MEYERRSVSKDQERDLITGMIVSSEFIKQINPVFKPEYLTLPYAKFVSKWSLEYWQKYEKAIDKDIIPVFESKKSEIRDEATIETIETFLNRLSERFEEQESYNVAYQVDSAIKLFKERALDLMIDRVKVAKMSGNFDQAEAEVSNFKRVEKGLGTASSVWCDIEEAMKVIHNDDSDVVLRFPGDLGKVIRPLTVDDFIAFIGPAKKGKTFWLIELATLGSLNRKNVLFVSLEMPGKKLRERIYQRVTGEVVSRYDETSDRREVDVPYFDSAFETTGRVFKKKEFRNQLSARSVIRKMKSVHSFVKSDNFRLINEPSNTFTAAALNAALDNLEHYDNFVPDIIVVDYADIMGADKRQDHRNMINDKWESLRTIGQQRKVLMATVSHTNKTTLSRDCRAEDVVEDARKLNHITLCIGINQLQEDKDNGVQRLAVLIDRVEEFNPAKEAVVTQCLAVGGVCLDSRIKYKGAKTE